MRNQEKKLPLSSPIGYSFLLTVMVVLTLVVFAVLSLATSLREYNYSKKAAEKTTAYYEANTKACHMLRQINEKIQGCESQEEVMEAVGKIPGVTVTEQESSTAVSYEVKINDRQELQVLLEVTADKSQTVVCQIKKWKEASSESWEEETGLPVLGSEF